MRNSVKSQYVAYMASIITAPCAKLMMRSTPKISDRPKATSPYTPPSSRPLMPACKKSSVVRLTVPLGDGEHRLGLGEARRAHDHRLAALDLEQRRRGVDVLAAVVELDRVLRQDVIAQVRPGQRLAELVAIGRARPLQRVLDHVDDGIGLHAVRGQRGAEALLVGGEDGFGPRRLRVVPVVAVEELIGELAVIGDELGVRVRRVGETDESVDADAQLGGRLRDDLGVAVVAA